MTAAAIKEVVATRVRPVKAAEPEPEQPPQLRIQTAAEFLAAFQPIESLVDGVSMPRGGLVSVTGPTGHGKTTLCCLLEACLATGRRFAGKETLAGAVLVLAGENPDDYAMHLAATLQDMGVPPSAQLLVVSGVFNIQAEMERIADLVRAAGVRLLSVLVDTSAAYNLADDENDNVAMRRHASMLRELTTLPGRPTAFVLCHPVKNATRDNLQPRGGGSFLAEVDVNLTVWKDEAGIVTLHHTKIRGAPFDPIRFELVAVELEGHKDARGRPIFSVAARHLPDEKAEQMVAKELDAEDRLLVAMWRKPEGSIADWCKACGFTSGMGSPQKSRASRMLAALVRDGYVDKGRGGTYRLSGKGKKEAERVQ